MLLTIDVGNTQTVIGLYDREFTSGASADAGLLDHWRIATDAARTADEHAVVIRGLLASSGYPFDVDGVAICAGVPRVLASLREMIDRSIDVDPVVIEPGVRTGMAILYDNPKEVGADRIANAVAALPTPSRAPLVSASRFDGPNVMLSAKQAGMKTMSVSKSMGVVRCP